MGGNERHLFGCRGSTGERRLLKTSEKKKKKTNNRIGMSTTHAHSLATYTSQQAAFAAIRGALFVLELCEGSLPGQNATALRKRKRRASSAAEELGVCFHLNVTRPMFFFFLPGQAAPVEQWPTTVRIVLGRIRPRCSFDDFLPPRTCRCTPSSSIQAFVLMAWSATMFLEMPHSSFTRMG